MKLAYRIFILVIVSFTIGGCGFIKQPDADQVLFRFSQQLAQLESVHYDLALQLLGGLSQGFNAGLDSAKFSVNGDIESGLNSPVVYTANVSLTGQGTKGPVQLGGKIIGLQDYSYFQINNLSLPSLLPIGLGDQQWYKIKSEQPAALSGQLSHSQQDEVAKILESHTPLSVSEVLPITSVGGRRAYHYKLNIDDEILNDVIAQLQETVSMGADSPTEFSLSGYQPEVFIDTKTYDLLRIKIDGIYTHDHTPTNLSLDLELSNHNEAPTIQPPAVVKEVDVGKLLGLPGLVSK